MYFTHCINCFVDDSFYLCGETSWENAFLLSLIAAINKVVEKQIEMSVMFPVVIFETG